MATSPSKFYELFRIALIAETILSGLTVADIVALQRVCRWLRDATLFHWDARFNLNTFLRDFIKDGASFRRTMSETDALIIGGPALNLLETSHRSFAYLHLLVEQGDHAERLIDYLQEHENYDELDTGSVPTEPFHEITQTSYSLILRDESEDTEIRVKTTNTFLVHALLRLSSMTAEINFISWNKLYSLFPLETLVNHKSYPLRPLDDTFGATLAELARQGWTTRDLAWLEFGAPTPIGIGIRRVGDSSSATVPITPKLTLPHATPDYVAQHAEFEVIDRTVQPRSGRRDRKIHGTRELRLHAEVLSSLALHYRYTTRESDAANSWSYFVGKRLNRWVKIELYKTPHNKRPFEITPYTEGQ